MEVGGWVQVSLAKKFIGKSSQVLIFWSSIPCVYCLYIIPGYTCTLLKVVSYDFVLSMSVMGFQKKFG